MKDTSKSRSRRPSAARASSSSAAPVGRAAATSDEVAVRAYELYVAAGRPPGRDLEFWLEAERQLRASK